MESESAASDGFGSLANELIRDDQETVIGIHDDTVSCGFDNDDQDYIPGGTLFDEQLQQMDPVQSTWSLVNASSSSSSSQCFPVQDAAIDNAILAGRRSVLPKFPWESNYMARVFGHSSNILDAYRLPDASTFAGYHAPRGYEPVKPIEPKNQIIPFAVRKLRTAAHPMSDDMIRNLAINKWRLVIEADIGNCEVGRQIQDYCETFNAEANILSILSDTFNKKATATLYKRANAFLPFVKWAMRFTEHPLKLQEHLIYAYVCKLRSTGGSATSGESFKQSLNFAIHLLGLEHDGHKTVSQRISGVCHEMYVKKRKLKQALPLKVAHVSILEYIAQFSENDKHRCVAGHLLFCIYSSCRWTDSQKVESIALLSSGGPIALIEAGVSSTKSATSQELKTQLLPLVALCHGVNSACEWGSSWMNARSNESLVADGNCLTPALSCQARWLPRRMCTAEATAYLRDLLISGGVSFEDANVYTSHSLKATALSWLAKHGVDVETRRLMGHHLHPTLKSVITYSRDALIHGHSILSNVIDEIVAGVFDPDSPRDVLLMHLKQRKARRKMDSRIEVNPTLSEELNQSASSVSSPAVVPDDIEHEANFDYVSMSSEGDVFDDIQDDELQSSLQAATSLWDSMSPATHPVFTVPNHSNTMQHLLHGTIHLIKDKDTLLCGRAITVNYAFTCAEDVVCWPMCEQCKLIRAINHPNES